MYASATPHIAKPQHKTWCAECRKGAHRFCANTPVNAKKQERTVCDCDCHPLWPEETRRCHAATI